MEFYHHLITQKSFEYLQDLKRRFRFTLIGGWAVFLYSRSLKSKDIDIIVDYPELSTMKEKYAFSKNEKLRKYEISSEEFDIDIYVPYYSDLGIEIEEIQKHTIAKEGFIVPELEILFLLKLHAWNDRRGTLKGRKDELDLVSLLFLPEFNIKKYVGFIQEFKFEPAHKNFCKLLKNTQNVPELGIHDHEMSKMRKKFFQ